MPMAQFTRLLNTLQDENLKDWKLSGPTYLLQTVYLWFHQHCETANRTHRREAFQWTPEVEAAFQTLQEVLCTACIFAHLQQGERSIFDTDVSNVGIAGALSQIAEGWECVTAYYNKMLKMAERNYCVTRWVLLAIIRRQEHFHKYFYGQGFHLRADHSTLTWLISFRNVERQTGC
jgi:hypothetical protein